MPFPCSQNKHLNHRRNLAKRLGEGGGNSDHGYQELQFITKSSRKEGKDWFEPALNTYTPPSSILIPIFYRTSSTQLPPTPTSKNYCYVEIILEGHLPPLPPSYAYDFHYTMRCIALHQTCTYIPENESIQTTADQQKQHVDAVGCRKIFSGLSAFIFCKYLEGALHPLAPLWLRRPEHNKKAQHS